MKKEVKEIIVDLIERLWKAESVFFETAADRNICEAELIEIYNDLDYHIGCLDDKAMADYEEEIEGLEEQLRQVENDNMDLIDRNYDLKEENEKLWDRIKEISKVVNDTWN